MSANPWSAVSSGISSGLTFVVKICEYTYALRAVDQQTREYFSTAQHASNNIKICQELLDQQEYLPTRERKEYERVIEETKRATEEVALLLEPARVDIQADCSIHLSTRVMWVLSDNSNVAAALRRLDIVHTTLTQNISTLRLLRTFSARQERPPSYKTSQFLQWKRENRLSPRPSTDSFQSVQTPRPSPQCTGFGRPWSAQELPTDTHEQPPNHRAHSMGSNEPLNTPALALPDSVGADTGPQSPATSGGSERDNLPELRPTWSDGSRPRTWLEYQAMKADMRRQERARTGRG